MQYKVDITSIVNRDESILFEVKPSISTFI